MRYRLRTLLMVVVVVPALIAIAVLSFWRHLFPGVPLSLAVISVPVAMEARESRRSVLFWLLLTWILGYAGCLIVIVTAGAVALSLLSTDMLPAGITPKAVAIPAALIGTYLGASIALIGARRPKDSPTIPKSRTNNKSRATR